MMPSLILQSSLAPPSPNNVTMGYLFQFSENYFCHPFSPLFYLLPLVVVAPNVVLSTSRPLGNPGD